MSHNAVKLIECPRDAWQGLKRQIPTELKARYLRALIAAGFKHIDAVSFVSPKAIPQMADSEKVLKQVSPPDDVEIIGGQGWTTSETGSDLTDKLSQLGMADAEQSAYMDALGNGGTLIAAKAPDGRKAEQLMELMQEHGATRCTHSPA